MEWNGLKQIIHSIKHPYYNTCKHNSNCSTSLFCPHPLCKPVTITYHRFPPAVSSSQSSLPLTPSQCPMSSFSAGSNLLLWRSTGVRGARTVLVHLSLDKLASWISNLSNTMQWFAGTKKDKGICQILKVFGLTNKQRAGLKSSCISPYACIFFHACLLLRYLHMPQAPGWALTDAQGLLQHVGHPSSWWSRNLPFLFVQPTTDSFFFV